MASWALALTSTLASSSSWRHSVQSVDICPASSPTSSVTEDSRKEEEHGWLAAGDPGEVFEHALRAARRESLCDLLDRALRLMQVPGQRCGVAGAALH